MGTTLDILPSLKEGDSHFNECNLTLRVVNRVSAVDQAERAVYEAGTPYCLNQSSIRCQPSFAAASL
jgi:hypothetical protein